MQRRVRLPSYSKPAWQTSIVWGAASFHRKFVPKSWFLSLKKILTECRRILAVGSRSVQTLRRLIQQSVRGPLGEFFWRDWPSWRSPSACFSCWATLSLPVGVDHWHRSFPFLQWPPFLRKSKQYRRCRRTLFSPNCQPPQPKWPFPIRIASPKLQHPKLQHPKLQHPKLQHPKLQHPKLQHPKLQHPKLQHPKLQHPKLQHPVDWSRTAFG